MTESKTDLLRGTLDLLVLKTLEAKGPMHGWGIARQIERVSEDLLQMNQGTLYPALLRLQQRGTITSKWGTSENNRKARFYSLTAAGTEQLQSETEKWRKMARVVGRVLEESGGP